MTTTQQILTILVIVAGTMLTRFLPFLLFPAGKTPPSFIRFLGKVLPNAALGLLVVYSLKDAIGSRFHCLPELIAILCVFILHKWKKSMFLSIIGGTLVYMLLVQNIFI